MNIHLITIGRMKNAAHKDMFSTYQKRMEWNIRLTELESRHKDQAAIHKDETSQILKALTPQSYIIALDERGKTYTSRDFAQKIQTLQSERRSDIQCIIGGADGLNDEIRKHSDLLLSFGKQTWPHMLARIMLLEQIYRSQQILKNHPYHRD